MKSLLQKLVSHQLLHLFIIWFSAISIIFEYVCGVSLSNNETVPAVIIFGDSIVDSGNNNYIDTLIKCNFPPYGRDFGEGNHPTGRFSNGLVPSDIISISIIFEYVCGVSLPNNETVPAVIIFGDSIVDSGNNNYIDTLIKCNFPPYGRDFGEGNHPTGRFSNGLVPSDIIASKFGVKELLPAYLDPDLQIQELLTGVSFASGGAGYDPLTSQLVSVMSLSDQLNMFKEYIGKLNDAIGGKRTATIISKSIYIVCIGSDDIANTYSQTPFRRPLYDIQSYTDLMVSEASNFLEELYGLGGRRIGVFNVPVIGCVPSQRTIGGGIMRTCSDFSNQLAILFNSKLSFQMDLLQTKFSDARFVYLDSYNPLLHILQNPSKYGFEEADRGCCGTGNIEVGILCNPYSINTCSNSSNYIFWDSYHPTEKTYHVLSSLVLDHKIKDFF